MAQSRRLSHLSINQIEKQYYSFFTFDLVFIVVEFLLD